MPTNPSNALNKTLVLTIIRNLSSQLSQRNIEGLEYLHILNEHQQKQSVICSIKDIQDAYESISDQQMLPGGLFYCQRNITKIKFNCHLIQNELIKRNLG